MDEDEDSSSVPAYRDGGAHGSSAAVLAATRRHRLWILGVLLVAGSCMLAVVHLANGLHAQLLANRKMVRTLKEQLIGEGEEREALLKDKDASMSKTSTLRMKSKLVTEELLEQQRKARRLQQELLNAREDLQILSKNCSFANQRLKNRYDVTVRALHDRVVTNEECRALLERNIDERAKLESSLLSMQDRAYNVSKMLKITKQKLKDALVIASNQRDEIIRLKRELEASKASGGVARSSQEEQNADTESDGGSASSAAVSESKSGDVASAWKAYVDKRTGRTYWYNSVTQVSQWSRPEEVSQDTSR